MKKLLFLALLCSALFSSSVYAQGGDDPAAMLQRMKERIKPQMVEKTGITAAQADKVIELNFEMRMAVRGLRDLSEADRSAKLAELRATKEKKISEVLTAEQIKAVNEFYESMAKSMPPKSGN